MLLDGNPTSSYLWRKVLPGLAREGRVLASDLMGRGRSGKPTIGYRFAVQQEEQVTVPRGVVERVDTVGHYVLTHRALP